MPNTIGGGVGGAATGAADRSTTAAGRRGCPPVNPSSTASPTMAGMQSSATSWAWMEDHSAVPGPSCWTACSAVELVGTGLPWWPSPLANRNAWSATSRTAPIRPRRTNRISAESIAPITSRSSPAVGSGGRMRAVTQCADNASTGSDHVPAASLRGRLLRDRPPGCGSCGLDVGLSRSAWPEGPAGRPVASGPIGSPQPGDQRQGQVDPG
jgi:hypothetical protein